MMIRYFCLVAPGSLGDVGYEYLIALEGTGIQLRALPIGPASAIGTERRWFLAGKLFTTPMINEFVNIVCAPCGFRLGTKAPMRSMGGTGDLVKQDGGVTDVMVFPPSLRDQLAKIGVTMKANADVVYEPKTAFGGMLTARCKNVAIVSDSPPTADEGERAALAAYDLVITTRPEDAMVLRALGLRSVVHIPPDAAMLASALEETCFGLGTSATGQPSRDMDARPETTWLRSTSSMESSSRSLTSQEEPPHQSLAIHTSTTSWFGSISSLVRQTWRSIMRSLVFWRR